MPRKDELLPCVDIMHLTDMEQSELMARQIPRRYRSRFAYEVVLWGVDNTKSGWQVPWFGVGYRLGRLVWRIDREHCWSTPLEAKPRRYRNRIVRRATIPQDMLAFLALMA